VQLDKMVQLVLLDRKAQAELVMCQAQQEQLGRLGRLV
jgi:hypothetical protein